MSTLTKEMLLDSKIYKDYISGYVALIHNTYHDSKDKSYSAFIVVSDETKYKHKEIKWQDISRDEFKELQIKINGSWTITRFFKIGDNINVSVDYADLPTEKVFEILLSEYSRGLE